jgi:hypothetical protein
MIIVSFENALIWSSSEKFMNLKNNKIRNLTILGQFHLGINYMDLFKTMLLKIKIS